MGYPPCGAGASLTAKGGTTMSKRYDELRREMRANFELTWWAGRRQHTDQQHGDEVGSTRGKDRRAGTANRRVFARHRSHWPQGRGQSSLKNGGCRTLGRRK
jgi:hypothetical protein